MKQLISNMLQFNPYFRMTASKLLESDAFKNISVEPEKAPFKFILPFDRKRAFDYKENVNRINTIDDLKN